MTVDQLVRQVALVAGIGVVAGLTTAATARLLRRV
jgi:hypothetical protein